MPPKRKRENEGGRDEVDDKVDAEQAQGFRGTKVDPTPNEAYTVAGVVEGAATPETDPELRAEARAARDLPEPEYGESAEKTAYKAARAAEKAGRAGR